MSTPTTVPSTSATIEPGRLVADRYLLLARVGRGGSGSVWRAHDQLLDREVAVKRLHGGQALDALRSAMIRERAHREGRVAARLHHPRLAAIYDMAELDGEVCLVMEYVAAPSLADLLDRDGPLPAGRVAGIGAQIAEGLAAMHRTGIVHRDIKPANVMIGVDDTVTVTDFGIAVIGSDRGADDDLVAGTPHYMAPELALGQAPTTKADMFSLGATLHAALLGAPPRPGASDALEGLREIAPDVVRPAGRDGHLGVVLRALLDLDPLRRPSAITTARRLAGEAVGVGTATTDDTGGRSSAMRSRPAATAELAPVHDPVPSRRRAAVEAEASDGADDATFGTSLAPDSRAGRHRVVLTAWRRPSRRVVLGTGLAGLLGVAGMVALATGPDPEPPRTPSAAPALAQAAPLSPPFAGPPIVPATPSAVTSTPFDEVASSAPTRSERTAPATAQTTAGDDREDGPGDDDQGDDEKDDKKDKKKEDKKDD